MTNLTVLSKLLLTSMMVIMTIMAINLIHPTLIILILLSYSTLLCMNLAPWKPSFMAPILFILIMISGLLIIFLYFSSLVSNEKSQAPYILVTCSLTTLIILFPTMSNELKLFSQPTLHGHISTELNPLILYSLTTKNIDQSLTLMYKMPASFLTIVSMTYLLATLISIIKINSPKMKSMRKMT